MARLRGAAALDTLATTFFTQMFLLYWSVILAVRPEEEPLTRTWHERWWRSRDDNATSGSG